MESAMDQLMAEIFKQAENASAETISFELAEPPHPHPDRLRLSWDSAGTIWN